MRRLSACMLVLIALAFSTPARAEGLNNLYAGINGILTFPADPVVMVVTPPEDWEDMPGHAVTARLLALPAGILLGTYRASMAVFDIVLFPFWAFPTMSPEPRWALIPDVEYE